MSDASRDHGVHWHCDATQMYQTEADARDLMPATTSLLPSLLSGQERIRCLCAVLGKLEGHGRAMAVTDR